MEKWRKSASPVEGDLDGADVGADVGGKRGVVGIKAVGDTGNEVGAIAVDILKSAFVSFRRQLSVYADGESDYCYIKIQNTK